MHPGLSDAMSSLLHYLWRRKTSSGEVQRGWSLCRERRSQRKERLEAMSGGQLAQALPEEVEVAGECLR